MEGKTMKNLTVLVMCSRCERLENVIEIFPGGLCLACYEREFNETEAQIPDFSKVVNAELTIEQVKGAYEILKGVMM